MGSLCSGRCGVPPEALERAKKMLAAEPPIAKAKIARILRISRATVHRIVAGVHFTQREPEREAQRCACGLKLYRWPCPRCGCDKPRPRSKSA